MFVGFVALTIIICEWLFTARYELCMRFKVFKSYLKEKTSEKGGGGDYKPIKIRSFDL